MIIHFFYHAPRIDANQKQLGVMSDPNVMTEELLKLLWETSGVELDCHSFVRAMSNCEISFADALNSCTSFHPKMPHIIYEIAIAQEPHKVRSLPWDEKLWVIAVNVNPELLIHLPEHQQTNAIILSAMASDVNSIKHVTRRIGEDLREQINEAITKSLNADEDLTQKVEKIINLARAW